MKKRKIVLAAFNAKYIHSNLAVYDLEAYCRKRWEEIEIFPKKTGKTGKTEENEEYSSLNLSAEKVGYSPLQLSVMEFTINHNLDYILQELYREKADIYAFSCYIWNIHEILTVARELKKLLKQSEIWLGGPEAGYDAKNYLKKNTFVNGIMLGEGEVTFYELTKFWNHALSSTNEYNKKNKPELKDIPGIIYRTEDGNILETEKRLLMDLDELPFVYQDLDRFQNKILYYETSRGCPFSCSYCLSSIEKQVRFRSFSLVKGELDFFLEHKVPQVKFVDRTFNCNKKHALEIWSYLFEHDNGVTNFHFEIAADLIGEEELALFKKMRPGLIQLEIGLQSTNPQTIREIRRVMDVEKVKNVLFHIKSFRNIHQHLDLIAGLPYEDFSSFQKSFTDAYEMKPDQLQLGFLKVLKGSYMGEQAENYELEYRQVQPYEVLCTKWLSYDDILVLKQIEEMVEVYYNSGQFRHTLPFLLSFFPDAFTFYETLGNYYQKKELFGIGFKREARYLALRDFCFDYFEYGMSVEHKPEKTDLSSMVGTAMDHCETKKKIWSVEDEKVLDSLLIFDYYLRENAKKRPAWSEKEPVEKKKYLDFFKNGGNEEISLMSEGYDSKAAARDMHIEPIVKEAYDWIICENGKMENEPDGKKAYDWIMCEDGKMENGPELYCLFDYEKRNPLTKDAKVTFLRGL